MKYLRLGYIQQTSCCHDCDCTVYTDWNDLKPMQKVTPNGSSGGREGAEEGGTNNYSSWTFTYS
jgi:hypothetical protein